mgnify:FL=1
MARIPMGNFGTVIAQPAPTVRIPAAAFDDGGSGAQKLGDTAMQVGVSLIDDQRRQDDALMRARAANAAIDREMAVDQLGREIEEEVTAGRLHYSKASETYKQRVAALPGDKFDGLSPVDAENYSRSLKRIDFKGEKHVETVTAKAKTADFRAQTDGILDKLGKQAGLPGTDMAALTGQIDAMDEIGRSAYGAAWEKRKQDWKDNSWDARLNQQAISVRNDLNGINALQQQLTGEYADKLDSNRRNTLVARLDGYKTSLIQRAEAASARADRAAERHLKKAEAEFNTFQSLADKGTTIDPTYIDVVLQKTAGTPYQQAVANVAKQAQENGGIASRPIYEQQAELDRIDAQIAKTGRTPELDKRREQLQKIVRGSQSDLKDNGLRAGLERGVIADMAPLDVSTPEAIAASIPKRIEQAEAVGAWAGKPGSPKPVSPFDSNEAEQIRNMLETLPPKQRSEAVSTIARSVGPRLAGAVAEQLDKQDKPLALAFAMAGSQTTTNRFTSELILKGAQAMKDGAVMKDDKKVTGWKASIASAVDGAFANEKAASAVKDAAYYIAAGIAQENGGSVSSSEIKRAVRLAVGGDIIERNGKKLPIPAGMEAGDFEKRLQGIPKGDILKQAPGGKVRVAGAEMSVEEFATSIPGQELAIVGPGRYAVIVKGRPVVNDKGRPIIVGVQ